jgi:hypothetical protein
MDPLAPAGVAAAVAPIIDRLRLSIANRMPLEAGDLLERHGLDPVSGQTIGLLRNLLPDRSTDRDHVRAAFLYWPDGQVDATLDRLVGAGLVEDQAEVLGLTEAGRDLVRSLRTRMETYLAPLWSGEAELVGRIGELTGRAVVAAADSGGLAYGLVSPVFEPAGTGAAMLLAERLTPLRFHRVDAHAAAWRAAGLSSAEVQVLGPGSVRDAIEADTNTRAAPPYAALSEAERFELVAGLGRLRS